MSSIASALTAPWRLSSPIICSCIPVLPVIWSSVSLAKSAASSPYPVFTWGLAGSAAGGAAFDVVRVNALVCIMSAGSAKPSTVFLNSVASCESLEIDAAVADVALPVWSPISLRRVVRLVTSAAAPACSRADPDMFCTRLAIWFETCSISSSAAPAFSASNAPPTTSVVLRSIETTASFVSA